MIYDHISNIERYRTLSEDIYEGLKFIKNAKTDLATGTYEINTNSKAGVSEYMTKIKNENGYETHDKYIDIQFLLSGSEQILCERRELLQVKVPYNEEKDITFYHYNNTKSTDLMLGNGYFAILFPDDGHAPQVCINQPETVKKIVIKVKING